MTKDTGGPAFPHSRLGSDADGMTLRDYLAIHAAEEDIQRHLPTGRTTVEANSLTGSPLRLPEYRTREQARYAFADAMLAARQA